MTSIQTLQFDSEGFRLTGDLHLPHAPHPPVIIGCHGLQANRQSPKQIALAEACTRQGLAYFRFDHRGCGDSQGNFEEVTSLTARRKDLSAAVAALRDHPGTGKLLGLFGSSFGGTVVLALGAVQPVPALVTYAAPINSQTLQKSAVIDANGHPILSKTLQASLQFDIGDSLGAVRNILIVHGQNDRVVPQQHARLIYQKAGEPKKIIIQPGGDHRMSDPKHQQQFLQQFLSWFQNRQ